MVDGLLLIGVIPQQGAVDFPLQCHALGILLLIRFTPRCIRTIVGHGAIKYIIQILGPAVHQHRFNDVAFQRILNKHDFGIKERLEVHIKGIQGNDFIQRRKHDALAGLPHKSIPFKAMVIPQISQRLHLFRSDGNAVVFG